MSEAEVLFMLTVIALGFTGHLILIVLLMIERSRFNVLYQEYLEMVRLNLRLKDMQRKESQSANSSQYPK